MVLTKYPPPDTDITLELPPPPPPDGIGAGAVTCTREFFDDVLDAPSIRVRMTL
jgi:hypothetical protein